MRKLKTIEMQRLSVEEFKDAPKLPLIVVLDDVRSLYNVGSVFRTCDAFRVEAVYLCGITGTPPNAEIHKTALGGEDSVDWRYFEKTEDAVQELHDRGYFVYSIEQVEGSTKLFELGNSKFTIHNSKLADAVDTAIENRQSESIFPCAVIFGNEVKGVKQSVVDMSDGCLEIPQFGTKHSLNVSVTAGIVVWEFAKMKLAKQPQHQQ
ncbi:RNA methyltransferase, TrmH family [Hallella bergensis DSM 17361]|uniref:RNA methyltransferase, TrmH family n=1 Tax=Hallella bergensis DSM 17361 TaxID=585502 RepID=D1PTQ4_9BACT|nr:RNA methyltransferase [Hallella bergensis]EFA45240.1 RNA methyltransferase, TrmH family [Hallella bergensis DSM 17361]